ncbi:MAG: KpsF/GutQ family sugar-phosphate isomerase [Candidatus Dadabacteria bacterium]|nr:MAG: KpsF/GutQ family sugar-phosphate isomerase [Candidatus Dadabacteria bacterium]
MNKDSSTDIAEIGRRILQAEAEAINTVAETLGEPFVKAVHTILNAPPTGRIVVSGMGKAGFIAMKISATLASTGTSSFFLHPAEAVHGDLGRYSQDDIALVLSTSGETPEILRVLPAIKRVGCPIISITSTADSSLAKHSDVVIEIGNIKEAGPLGLAPTTSTTVMLAVGDALAMAVLEHKGFSKEEFAFYHPGGSLGRKLMKVKDLMRTGEENAVVEENVTVREAIHVITTTKGRPGACAVVDSSGILKGVFTDGNLRRCLESGKDFLDKPIKEVMGRNPKTVAPDSLVEEALNIISKHKIDQLIVVSKDFKPLGLLDIQDIMSIR